MMKIILTFDDPAKKLSDEDLKVIAHEMGMMLLEKHGIPSIKNVVAEEIAERRIL